MQYFLKYLTTAPVMAAFSLTTLALIAITLNLVFPGLQYGTFFKPVP